MRRTRSGFSASTAPSSWLTSTTAPAWFERAPRISSRLAGSRLFVGSSSSSTFADETTSIASASRVFSPPERTPAGLAGGDPGGFGGVAPGEEEGADPPPRLGRGERRRRREHVLEHAAADVDRLVL